MIASIAWGIVGMLVGVLIATFTVSYNAAAIALGPVGHMNAVAAAILIPASPTSPSPSFSAAICGESVEVKVMRRRRQASAGAGEGLPPAVAPRESPRVMADSRTAKLTAGCEVRRIRAEALPKMRGGLRALHRTRELPGANPLKAAPAALKAAHAALNAAVLAAYGFAAKADLLAQLLARNQTVAARLARAEPVTAPGLPAGFPPPATLISDDCIRPATV